MAENVVSIGFSKKEFSELESSAKAKGISIQQYIKFKVLEDSEFYRRFEELKQKVQNIPKGTKFSIRMVFGTDWLAITKGVRLSLGRNFFDQLNAKIITGVTVAEKDSANTQLYLKD